ncbi:lysophosphatidic acid phosphatase type 6 isoform X1 [Electrophorus electricus]|uniref:lysophosphatidic acid phosphatase type 6 isoform X1 n=1 Tax=Electrophorus electricus TaxID=8005 RepID=UPI0015CFC324|nr:lysophosphatidic acid phosphatase type 6 isoform X1 [Electrophorus electricus]XP_026888382.2 lysophosphatidic acid phosphatase type 6 isoform X1 [Electrophorus electricus]XP_026888389.2 lysophosphatidic acid phosphatase type 6 isoform X1 [Electrophorus electricus]
MRTLWTRIGTMGTVALGSTLWSQKKTEAVRKDVESDKTSSTSDQSSSPYELKLVQVLFRHGARTPLKSIPDVLEAQWVPDLLEVPDHTKIDYVVKDLHGGPRPSAPVEDSYRASTLTGGTYPGQLTTVGMQQLYDLGLRLRRRYIQDVEFLSPSFSLKEVYIRSTNIVRTIESAKCLVAGLFQQQQTDTVLIYTEEAAREILYPNYHGCKLLKMLNGYRWAESATLPNIASDLQTIQAELGISPCQRLDFILIRDDMVARETHGMPYPSVLQNWKPVVEQRAVDMIYHIYEPSNRQTLQLCVGPVFHTLLTNMETKVNGIASDINRARKLFLYSVHDTTLMPCLIALGVFDMRWPPYAADITLELYWHRQIKQHYVKVSYIGQDQKIPGCSDVYCPLEEFKQVLAMYALPKESYHDLCNHTQDVPIHCEST